MKLIIALLGCNCLVTVGSMVCSQIFDSPVFNLVAQFSFVILLAFFLALSFFDEVSTLAKRIVKKVRHPRLAGVIIIASSLTAIVACFCYIDKKPVLVAMLVVCLAMLFIGYHVFHIANRPRPSRINIGPTWQNNTVIH